MKSNFHVNTRRDNHLLHIYLHGIFDGASAFELIDVILKKEDQAETIQVDTSHLTETLPFGKSILNTHLPKNGLRSRIRFSGAQAGGILPEGCVLLEENHRNAHVCKGTCKNCACRKAGKKPVVHPA